MWIVHLKVMICSSNRQANLEKNALYRISRNLQSITDPLQSGLRITCEINKGNMQDVHQQLKSQQLATELTQTDIIENILKEWDPSYSFQTTREDQTYRKCKQMQEKYQPLHLLNRRNLCIEGKKKKKSWLTEELPKERLLLIYTKRGRVPQRNFVNNTHFLTHF